jgi:hypothetical protein
VASWSEDISREKKPVNPGPGGEDQQIRGVKAAQFYIEIAQAGLVVISVPKVPI